MVAARIDRTFHDHDVIAYRNLVRIGRVRPKYIATAHEVGPTSVAYMLTGKTYSELPGALTREQIAFPDYFGDAVYRLRLDYAARRISRADITRRFTKFGEGPSRGDIVAMLTGRTYAGVPGALQLGELRSRRGHMSPEAVLFLRLAFNGGRVSVGKLSEAYRIDDTTCKALLSGALHPEVPEAIVGDLTDREKFQDRFTARRVFAIRRRFVAEHPRLTCATLAKEHGVASGSMKALLTGRTYASVPGAVTPEMLHEAQKMAMRKLSPEVALFARLQYHPEKVSAPRLAHYYGVHHEQMYRLLVGKSYEDVPCRVETMAKPGMARGLTDEVVVSARRRFAAGGISIAALAKEAGINASGMQNAVFGLTYKDLPDAVPIEAPRPQKPRHPLPSAAFADEVALFIRLQYHPERVPVARLCEAYGARRPLIYSMLTGRTYRHVPMAGHTYVPEEGLKPERKLTTEQVVQGRAWAHAGTKTHKEIAKALGICVSGVRNMITGKTYSEIPGAVPESLRTVIRRVRKLKPIKPRPIRLRDHDATIPRHQRLMAAE